MLQRPVISQVLNSSLPPWITFEWDWGSAWGFQEIYGSYYKYAAVLGLGPLTQFLAPFHLEQRLRFLQPCITGRQENQQDVPLFQRGSPHSAHQFSPTPSTFMKNETMFCCPLYSLLFQLCLCQVSGELLWFFTEQCNCLYCSHQLSYSSPKGTKIHFFFVLFSIDWVFSCWSTPKATYNKLN